MPNSPVPSPFVVSDPSLCYLDGNSLGRLPKAAESRIQTLVREGWGGDLIRGWNADWIDLPMRLGSKLAKLMGAKDGEVIVADSTSVNLFKLATAALRRQAGRSKIVTDATNFPSDLYVLEAAAQATGQAVEIVCVGETGSVASPTDDIIRAIDDKTALVCLTHVSFRSGAITDMERVTDAAQRSGAISLWDVSHSVGAVPFDLGACKADLAVGCTYKYLCGGPGSPAFLYVRSDLQQELDNPIPGWFSHRRPFDFEKKYEPANGLERFLTGTPPVISLAAIEAGVDLVLQAGVSNLRNISIELTSFLFEEIQERCGDCGFEFRSPRDASERGSHVSIGHREAQRITAALIEFHNVIPDFRTPDNVRLGIAPLYTTRADVVRAIDALEETMHRRQFERVQISSSPVT